MKKTELLNQLIHFNEEACNCQVVLDGANIISKFKSESKLDMQNINQTFEELGFRHIRVRKYTNDDCVWHTLGTEKMELKDLIYDISYRLEYYSSVRKKLCATLKKYTEDEISAFLNVTHALIYELEVSNVRVEDIFGITEEQKALLGTDNINQFNSLLVLYLLRVIHSHKNSSKNNDNKLLSKIYDYSFSIFSTTNPFDKIEFGEKTNSGDKIFGLKLKGKDVILSDFLEELSCNKAINILYKKSYGNDISYLTECLRCTYYIALGLETDL